MAALATKFWEALSQHKVRCTLCPHTCQLDPGQKGLCGVRLNNNGSLRSMVSDAVAAVNVDPVEKKPLNHYLPGTRTYSIGTEGCNLACAFCQNYSISRRPADTGVVHGKRTTAEILVGEARRTDCDSISFTYNEPTVFYELMYETAGFAQAHGLSSILVSNGYMGREALEGLFRHIKAANIDLKSFRDSFYRKHCKASLTPVLDNLKLIKKLGWWLEVTTLVIPGRNDSPEELTDIANFICNELGCDVPWHISRFHGAYQWQQVPSTPLATLEHAWDIGRQVGLNYVYVGNAGNGAATSTWCPRCQAVCVSRTNFRSKVFLHKGCCPVCGAAIAGVWR